MTQWGMNNVITHELVHAYDHCRAEIDYNNLRHLACTEASEREREITGEEKEAFGVWEGITVLVLY